ncbi:unnamed protein product, partial [marine sediment metagenome]
RILYPFQKKKCEDYSDFVNHDNAFNTWQASLITWYDISEIYKLRILNLISDSKQQNTTNRQFQYNASSSLSSINNVFNQLLQQQKKRRRIEYHKEEEEEEEKSERKNIKRNESINWIPLNSNNDILVTGDLDTKRTIFDFLNIVIFKDKSIEQFQKNPIRLNEIYPIQVINYHAIINVYTKYKYCPYQQRSHNSNNIYFVIRYHEQTILYKCHRCTPSSSSSSSSSSPPSPHLNSYSNSTIISYNFTKEQKQMLNKIINLHCNTGDDKNCISSSSSFSIKF